MPSRGTSSETKQQPDIKRAWGVVKARKLAYDKGDGRRGARELYQALEGLGSAVAEIEQTSDPLAASGLQLSEALQLAAEADALTMQYLEAADAAGWTIKEEQDNFLARLALRILLLFVPPHLEDGNQQMAKLLLEFLFVSGRGLGPGFGGGLKTGICHVNLHDFAVNLSKQIIDSCETCHLALVACPSAKLRHVAVMLSRVVSVRITLLRYSQCFSCRVRH
jgi:hypothetical protein